MFLERDLGHYQDQTEADGLSVNLLFHLRNSHFASGIETATFKGQTAEEIDRLLHMVVVGGERTGQPKRFRADFAGGPTGVEYAAELHVSFFEVRRLALCVLQDFLVDDLSQWYPEIANRVRITLVEALPSVLPMFSKVMTLLVGDSKLTL